MTKQGWELKSLKDYGKDGSVMELVKEDSGTLSVVTIMKKNQKTGKIPCHLKPDNKVTILLVTWTGTF